jgi:hypothetical protein
MIEPRKVVEGYVLSYLRDSKFKRVLDIGGAQRPWASAYVTHYVDLIHPRDWAKKYPECWNEYVQEARIVIGDIEDVSTWNSLQNIVGEQGRFDFIIATHLIEHLGNPEFLLSSLPYLGHAGFIATPSKHTELSRRVHHDHAEFRGMLPHRWICTVRESVLWMFPKLNFIEYLNLPWISNSGHELSFWWNASLPYHIVKDDVLDFPGPDPGMKYYEEELPKGL